MGSESMGFRVQSWTTAALVVALAFGIFCWSRVDFSERTIPGGDTCVYMLLARSLRDQGDLRSTWSVGERPHGQLSPAFPAMLIPFLTDSGLNVAAVRVLIIGMAAVSIFFLFFVFRHTGEMLAFAVILFTSLNSLVYLYGRSILSEIPYLFLSIAALLLWGYYEHFKRRDIYFEALLAATLAAAFLMRTIGVFLIVAVFIRMLIVPGFGGVRALVRRPFLFWSLLAVVAGWLLRQLIVAHLSDQNYWHEFFTGDEGRGASLIQIAGRWFRGGYALALYSVPQVLTNIRFGGRSAWAFLLAAVCGFGILRGLLLKRRVMDIYVAAYFLAAASWPWVQTSGARYVTPFVPFLFYYFFRGTGELLRLAEDKVILKSLVLGFAGAVAIVYGMNCPLSRFDVPSAKREPPQWAVYQWVRNHVPVEEPIASFDPAAMFFYTGRHSPDIAVTTMGKRELSSLLHSGKARWLVDDDRLQESRTVVGAILRREPTLLDCAFQSGPYRVYRVVRE